MKALTGFCLVVLSLLLGALGYGGGYYLAMRLGLLHHNNYEYYLDAPLGVSLSLGGAVLGFAAPWLAVLLVKR
jgi:hypothetical protein